MYKLDLHTHSIGSPDGGLTVRDYRRMLERGGLDYIAITDHNSITKALEIQRALGERIILGEEIMTSEGELIGLYLKQAIEPGLSAEQTARAIHAQGGLVYVPHAFETVRKGLSRQQLDRLLDQIDVIESYNGRAAWRSKATLASQWAEQQKVAAAASSDVHGRWGWGRTYTVVSKPPTAANLPKLLRQASSQQKMPGPLMLLQPSLNRLKRWGSHA